MYFGNNCVYGIFFLFFFSKLASYLLLFAFELGKTTLTIQIQLNDFLVAFVLLNLLFWTQNYTHTVLALFIALTISQWNWILKSFFFCVLRHIINYCFCTHFINVQQYWELLKKENRIDSFRHIEKYQKITIKNCYVREQQWEEKKALNVFSIIYWEYLERYSNRTFFSLSFQLT